MIRHWQIIHILHLVQQIRPLRESMLIMQMITLRIRFRLQFIYLLTDDIDIILICACDIAILDMGNIRIRFHYQVFHHLNVGRKCTKSAFLPTVGGWLARIRFNNVVLSSARL